MQTTRRDFLAAAAAAGTAIPAVANFAQPDPVLAESRSANNKLNIGVVGVAGKGASNLAGVANENVVVLCDIDASRLIKAHAAHPRAKTTDDFRRIFDHKLDAVVCSTPDHMHAFVVAEALRRGLHVYCEKPLTHSLWETRQLRNLAKQADVATQMGTQIHAGDNYRRVVEAIQRGVIGKVRRVHVWQGGGVRVFNKSNPGKPPAGINYDQWIGPAPFRPYDAAHFHFNWRYWWDFGGGQLADFGCHYMDLPYWALGLRVPSEVVAYGEKGHDGVNECPNFMRVDYSFRAEGKQPDVHMTWYHGGWKPKGAEVYGKSSAVLFEGEHGRLLADYSTHKFFMQGDAAAKPPEPFLQKSLGHHAEWIVAAKSGSKSTCDFDYSGALTEAVHLGNVSYRVGGKKLIWDAENLKATNCPEADQFIRREYRKGWVL